MRNKFKTLKTRLENFFIINQLTIFISIGGTLIANLFH